MCMMVYIASDEPLEELAWSEATPAFNTTPLAEREGRVRKQFSKTHVLYAGSHHMCSCGFQLAHEEDPDERLLCRRSLSEFAAYLRKALRAVDAIELYACWDGDQEARPEHHRDLTPASLEADDFLFLERELSLVTAEGKANRSE